ncbi:RNA polymerase sigma factor [Paenibacillus cymbidii]|uniref:RNA polymerase sigma factor n=1 Tax=Paenibacillus cymbidii TaxID=1639034 RepID=UPI001F23EB39|nr:sigma factor [Paenibacillus cymbidii]
MKVLEWRESAGRDEAPRRVLLRGDQPDKNVQPEAPRMTENELVERARAGNHEAFDELVRKHRAAALGVANRMVRDIHLAEDVVQDALIRAFMHLGTQPPKSRSAAPIRPSA